VAVPILHQSEYLIATVQSALSDSELVELRDALIDRVIRHRARGVVIDLTVVDVLDSFASRTLRDIATMVRLRGARTVVVGIQPDIAFAMAQLGITLDNMTAALDVEAGLACLASGSRR
jgi:rsbT antagonist protein RsbS